MYQLLPLVLPSTIALAAILRGPRWRFAGFAFLAGNLTVYSLVAIIYIQPFSQFLWKGPWDADASLWVASPQVWTPAGDYIGLTKFTAEELNRTRHGSRYRDLTYVPAHVPSTGQLLVSVNPIDDYTWARRPCH